MSLELPEKGLIIPRGAPDEPTLEELNLMISTQLQKMGLNPEEFLVYPQYFSLILPGSAAAHRPDTFLPMYVVANKITGWAFLFLKMGDAGLDRYLSEVREILKERKQDS